MIFRYLKNKFQKMTIKAFAGHKISYKKDY